MPSDHRTTPPSLEDLLRLKRAERPSPEFWTRFDSELRQKQLSALMERRAWWQVWPQQLLQGRALMPASAAAMLAVAVVSFRLAQPTHVAVNTPEIAVPMEQTPALLATAPSPALVSEPSSQEVVAAVQTEPALVAETNDPSVTELSSQLPENAGEVIPWATVQPAQSLAEILHQARMDGSDTASDDLLPASFASVALPAVALKAPKPVEATDELAGVSEQNSKRSRLLARLSDRQFTPDPRASASVRERLVRRLDASLNDHITRIGLKGDQVSLRF